MRVASKQPRLSVGSTGPAVLKLEQELKKRGLLKGPVDSTFDAATKQAVKRFERRQGWKVDGIAGRQFWKKLDLAGAAHEGSVGQVTQGSTKFTTVNINVRSNPPMSQAQVVHDVKRAAAAGDIIGWNEIDLVKGKNGQKTDDRYFDAVKALGPDWGHYLPRDGKVRIPNPISWKKKEWDLVDSGFRRTHRGLSKVSPNRYVTWVKLKNKKTGKTIIRMNTHLVSGGWSPKKQRAREWRQDRWHVHMRKLKELVAGFERSGTPVIIGGDFNRNHFKVLGKSVKYDNDIRVGTHGSATLDYVMHTPSAELKRTGGRVQGAYASDHDAVVVNYQLG